MLYFILGSGFKRWKNWKTEVGTWEKRCWNPEAKNCDHSVGGVCLFTAMKEKSINCTFSVSLM